MKNFSERDLSIIEINPIKKDDENIKKSLMKYIQTRKFNDKLILSWDLSIIQNVDMRDKGTGLLTHISWTWI